MNMPTTMAKKPMRSRTVKVRMPCAESAAELVVML